MRYKNPVIIDTDIGDDIDDTWTLMLILASRAFDVKMIILTNFDTDYKAKLTAKMLAAVGREDIPLVVMPSTKIPDNYKQGQAQYIQNFYNYSGIIIKENALQYIADEIISSYKKVCIFELGPNTTLAALIEKHPKICQNSFVYAMAGAVNRSYETLDKVVGEFNIACDKTSAEKVFASQIDYTMLPLDVCAKIRLKDNLYQKFLQSNSVYANVIKENYQVWLKDGFFENVNDFEKASSIIFDFVVPFYALFPENFEMRDDSFFIDSNHITKIGKGKAIKWAAEVQNMDAMLEYAVRVLS